MSGWSIITSAALTTANIIGPGGEQMAASPPALALLIVMLMGALFASAMGAAGVVLGPSRRRAPGGPALPKLKRRMNGPRNRRS